VQPIADSRGSCTPADYARRRLSPGRLLFLLDRSLGTFRHRRLDRRRRLGAVGVQLRPDVVAVRRRRSRRQAAAVLRQGRPRDRVGPPPARHADDSVRPAQGGRHRSKRASLSPFVALVPPFAPRARLADPTRTRSFTRPFTSSLLTPAESVRLHRVREARLRAARDPGLAAPDRRRRGRHHAPARRRHAPAHQRRRAQAARRPAHQLARRARRGVRGCAGRARRVQGRRGR